MNDSLKSTFQAQKRLLTFVFIFLILFFLVRGVLGFLSEKTHKEPIITVGTAIVKTQNVPVFFAAIGTVTPIDSITVKTQINGTLTNVYFDEGQTVKAGQLLAQIDPRPYQAQLLQYQGALLRDQALLANANVDLKRYVNLYETRSVSQQTLDTQASLVKQYQGAVKIDQGQIDSALTNLSYCQITSPVSGRIGIMSVDPGNFVQTSDANGIAVVTTLDPIQIQFSLPQQDITTIAPLYNAKKTLIVEAFDRDQKKLLATGTLSAMDNQIDTSTGTVNFKADFQNPNVILFPNQFVNVKLQVDTLKNALVVPTAAIQEGSQGNSYVYRYNTNKTVSNVPVKTSVTDGEYTVITSGLSVNQMVVTEGADRLYDGEVVDLSHSDRQ